MVETTKGKNITVETYDAASEEFTGDGTKVDFVLTAAIAESDIKYSRAYVDNEEVAISAIVPATKTVTLAAAPSDGAVVVIHVPAAKNGAFSIQQDVRFKIGTKTEDVKELGNAAVTRDVVERVGTLDMTFAQAKNHAVMTKLAANSDDDKEMVIAVKYKNTTPVSYRIFKEAKVADLGSGIAAGGVASENVSFNWKPPIAIKTT